MVADNATLGKILVDAKGMTLYLFDKDEKGGNGWDVSAMALAKGNAGGTMALNMPTGSDIHWQAIPRSGGVSDGVGP